MIPAMTKHSWIPIVAALAVSCTLGCKKEETTSPDEVAPDTEVEEPEAEEPEDEPEEPEVLMMTKASFDETIQEHFGEVSDCYLSALEASPDIKGKLGAVFAFDADGVVTAVTVAEGSTLTDESLVQCITEASKGWEFGKPKQEGMTMRFDFNLEPG